MTAILKFIIITYLLLVGTKGNSQIQPDSMSVKYYPSGKKQEETAFFKNKKLFKKNFYEEGFLKEGWYYDYKKGYLEEYFSLSEDRNKHVKIYYRKNGHPSEELHTDSTGIVTKDKYFNRKGKLKEVSTLMDKDQYIFFVQVYNRSGRIKRTYYTYPQGTSPILKY